jgi:hypothetical protein
LKEITVNPYIITRRNEMATKTAKVKEGEVAAYQVLLGFSKGMPSIDKAKPVEKKTSGQSIQVDDGVITSSAGQEVYWILGTKYKFVKKIDVNLS